MKRVLFGMVAAAAVFAVTGSAGAKTVLRLHSWASPKHYINTKMLPTWCANVAKATKGNVECKITFPPRMPPPRMFDRARAGIADITWGLHDYTPGRFKAAELAELPYWNASSEIMAVAYWRTHQKFLAKANEHRGVKLLGLTVSTGGVFQTKFPVMSVADLKGKKMRVAGGVAKQAAERLGIIPVGAPAPKVYSMLQQGIIEGVLFTPETAVSFRTMEVISHMILVPEGLYYSTFFLVMNQAKWNSLSKEDQKAIDSVSGEAYARLTGAHWDKADPEAIVILKKRGIKVTTAPPKMREEIRKRIIGIRDKWIKEAAKTGIDAKAAMAYMEQQIKELKAKAGK